MRAEKFRDAGREKLGGSEKKCHSRRRQFMTCWFCYICFGIRQKFDGRSRNRIWNFLRKFRKTEKMVKADFQIFSLRMPSYCHTDGGKNVISVSPGVVSI